MDFEMNYEFFSLRNKWTTKYAKLFQNCHDVVIF